MTDTPTTTDPDITSVDVYERRRLARTLTTPPAVLVVLANDPDARTRENVAGNRCAPRAAFAYLVTDPDAATRAAARATLARIGGAA